MTDPEILAAQRWLASNEGIFVEPASAASIAGLFKILDSSNQSAFPSTKIPEGAKIVCTVTGHGLKDPDIAKDQCGALTSVPATREAILRLL